MPAPPPTPRRRSRRRPTILLLMAVVALVAAGLVLMRFAREGRPVNRTFRTVYVPLIKGEGLSRQERLRRTELVIESIERTTPLKVVGSAEEADFTFAGDSHFVPSK